MKSFNPIPFRSSCSAGLLLALTLASPALFAAEPAKAAEKAGEKAADKAAAKIDDYRSNDTDVNKAEVKTALDQIDSELKHLDNLADNADYPEQKDAIKARYKILKQRRDDLKKDFTRARYETFKSDLKDEMNKLNNWRKEKFASRPAANSALGDTTASADTTAAKIADYRAEATDINKAEVKASLEHLDTDIDLLAAKIDALTEPMRKEELKQRLKALKDRRSELNREFRKARYDALVADVKSEWNELVH